MVNVSGKTQIYQLSSDCKSNSSLIFSSPIQACRIVVHAIARHAGPNEALWLMTSILEAMCHLCLSVDITDACHWPLPCRTTVKLSVVAWCKHATSKLAQLITLLWSTRLRKELFI